MRSYRRLYHLNRRHGALERWALALPAWAGGLAVTGQGGLARRLGRDLIADRWFVGLRRTAWLTAWGWVPWGSPRSDPFFFPTLGLDANECAELAEFIDRRAPHRDTASVQDARTSVYAGWIQALALEGQTIEAAHRLNRLYDEADRWLAALERPRALAPSHRAERSTDSGAARETGDFARSDAARALADVRRLLPADPEAWCVINGTALGLHREGDFLAHDLDIDLGVFTDSIDLQRILAAARRAAFLQRVEYETQVSLRLEKGHLMPAEHPVLVKLVHRNGIAVDLSLLHREGGRIWHGTPLHRWEHLPFGTQERSLRGVPVPAPDPIDQYLTEAYGDWRTPVSSFNCSAGSRNLTPFRNPLSLALMLKRLSWSLDQGDPEAYDATLGQLEDFGCVGPAPDRCVQRNWL